VKGDLKMKIRTANNDRYASADIDYQPSLCFQAVADRLDFSCGEEDTSIYDEMLRDTALFVDVLELLKMVGISKTKCFKKAFEGLVDGLVYDLVTEYGVRDNNYETDKLIVDLKKKIYSLREKEHKKLYG
jgi:hypothetical protein